MLQLSGEIRKIVSLAFGGYNRPFRLTQHESLAVAQIEPRNTEISRAGLRYWGGAQNGATGRAPVQAVPTTAAAFLLWNGSATRSYVIENITIAQLSGTAGVGGAILAALTTGVISKPSAATGYATASTSASTRASQAVWADNQTLGATPTWSVLKGNGNPATTTNGGDSIDVDGAIIVPPGYGLALNYLSGTGTTPLFLASARWSELELTLE